jgi:glucose/arabinose dehydrogenase
MSSISSRLLPYLFLGLLAPSLGACADDEATTPGAASQAGGAGGGASGSSGGGTGGAGLAGGTSGSSGSGGGVGGTGGAGGAGGAGAAGVAGAAGAGGSGGAAGAAGTAGAGGAGASGSAGKAGTGGAGAGGSSGAGGAAGVAGGGGKSGASGAGGKSGASGASGSAGAGGGAAVKFCDLPAPDEPGLKVPEGFCVRRFANVEEGRVLRIAPNGDVFVAVPAAFTPGGASGGLGAIVVLPDDNHDGQSEGHIVYAGDQTSPDPASCATHEGNEADLYCVHGLAFADGYLYYTRSDELRRFPYAAGDRSAPQAAGELVSMLGGNGSSDIRWTHTVDRAQDGTLYVSRGRQESSTCTDASMGLGALLSIQAGAGVPMPTTFSVSSTGYRNPMYLRCSPTSPHCFANELSGDGWSGVGGREKMVVIKDGDVWGYPCCVGKGMPFGSGVPAGLCDTLSEELISINLHDTPFGLDFETGRFPAPFTNGAFVALHGSFGSWEGTALSYLTVDPATSLPTGELVPFATGWGSSPSAGVDGRATDVAFAPDGRMFVLDDTSGGVWWIAPVDLEAPAGWAQLALRNRARPGARRALGPGARALVGLLGLSLPALVGGVAAGQQGPRRRPAPAASASGATAGRPAVLLPSASGSASGAAVPGAPTAGPVGSVGTTGAGPGARPEATNNYAMTISGGISLGAYEAGFNWAMLRLLKAQRAGAPARDPSLLPQDLVAVTGASAGNINGVLTAIAWCQRDALDDEEGLQKNVFWRTWVPVGWSNLFPWGKSCARYARDAGLTSLSCQPGEPAYQSDDGLLTRRAFADVEADIKRRLADGDRFRSGCRLPVGVTVTKVTPERIEQSDKSGWSKLEVATQRMAVLLEAESCPTSGGCPFEPGLAFSQPPFHLPRRAGLDGGDGASERSGEGLFGKRLIVPASVAQHVDARTLLDVVEASSAFPLAFGPKMLKYCDGNDKKSRDLCRSGPNEAKFFDGGLFDNVPLGLAIGLASSTTSEGRVLPDASAARRAGQSGGGESDEDTPHVTFIYLDPDRRRRAPSNARGQEREDLGRGYTYLLRLVERFVSVSRTYELQTTSRFRSASSYEVAPTSRLFPIMGQHLGAFAAFLARPFREHDFYVGVYEAMYAHAMRSCGERRARAVWPEGRLAACMAREMARSFSLLKLGAPDAEAASFVVRRLMRLELDAWLDRPVADAVLEAESPVWRAWLDAADTVDPLLKGIFEANLRMYQQARMPGQQNAEPEDRFDDLLRAVREPARIAHLRGKITDVEWSLFEDPETFYWSTARAISERFIDIEREDGRGVGKGLAGAIAFGIYAYSSGRSAGGNFDLDPSTIPQGSTWGKVVGHVLPYYGTTELVRGGLEIGYRPTLHMSRSLAFATPLSPLSYTRVEERTDFRGGLSLMRKFESPFFNSLELGPFVRAHYRSQNRWDLGAPSLGLEVSANTLVNHLRVSLGVNDIIPLTPTHQGESRSPPSVTLRFGLSDLNGLLYWGGRFLVF